MSKSASVSWGDKWLAILCSPRFQQIVGAFVVQTLQHYGVIDAYLANSLTALFAGSVVVGTVDKFAQTK